RVGQGAGPPGIVGIEGRLRLLGVQANATYRLDHQVLPHGRHLVLDGIELADRPPHARLGFGQELHELPFEEILDVVLAKQASSERAGLLRVHVPEVVPYALLLVCVQHVAATPAAIVAPIRRGLRGGGRGSPRARAPSHIWPHGAGSPAGPRNAPEDSPRSPRRRSDGRGRGPG